METQRPCANQIRQLQIARIRQSTIKIKPASRRPNLLREVPTRNSVGSWGGVLVGGDNLALPPEPLELYYPKPEFSQRAQSSADSSIGPVARTVQSGFA